MFANENMQHVLLILDFDVDHILTANTVDDDCLNVQTVVYKYFSIFI